MLKKMVNKASVEQFLFYPTFIAQAIGSTCTMSLTLPSLHIETFGIRNHKRRNGLASGMLTANDDDLAFAAECSESYILLASISYNR